MNSRGTDTAGMKQRLFSPTSGPIRAAVPHARGTGVKSSVADRRAPRRRCRGVSETRRANRRGQGGKAAGIIASLVFLGIGLGVLIPLFVVPLRTSGFTDQTWFGLIPAFFAVIGAVGLISSFRQPKPSDQGPKLEPDASGVLPPEARHGRQPRKLAARTSPGLRFLAVLLFAAFWNGIIHFFVRDVVAGWRAGDRPYFSTIFLLPFLVVGVGAVAVAFLKLLAIWNPRPTLTLSPGQLEVGGRADLSWELSGAVHRVKKLTLRLEGREEATYVRGTDRKTDVAVFARMTIAEGDAYGNLRRGNKRFDVPAGTMHSFASSNNKIVWVIKVHGQIAWWPDIEEEFPVGVVPAGVSSAGWLETAS